MKRSLSTCTALTLLILCLGALPGQQPAARPDPDASAKVRKLSETDLLKQMASENLGDRDEARRELVRRGEKSRPALLKLLRDGEVPRSARVAALGALLSLWNADAQTGLLEMLRDPTPELRRLAADGLALKVKPGDRDVHEALIQLLNDEDRTARRAVILAIGKVGAPGAADVLVNALQFDDGKDAALRAGIIRAISLVGDRGVASLFSLLDSGDRDERDRAVEAFIGLRNRAGALVVPRLLRNRYLTEKQRVDLALSALKTLAATGRLREEKAQALVLALLDSPSFEVRRAALAAVARAHLEKAAPQLLAMLKDASRSPKDRLALVTALIAIPQRAAVPLLKGLAFDNGQSAALRGQALRALHSADGPMGQSAAISLLQADPVEVRRAAVRVLGTQVEGARKIGQLFLKKELARNLLPEVADALRPYAVGDAELGRMFNDVLKLGLLSAHEPAEVERVHALVSSRGSPQRGRQLFLYHKALKCAACHRLESVGGQVGPDLTGVRDTHTVEKLLEALLSPSKSIKPGYQAYEATTKDNKRILGLKISQNADALVLRGVTGKEVRIATKDLAKLTPSKKSLMPADLARQLTFNQLMDLLAFLKDRAAQESLRGAALDFWVVGPFGPGLQPPYGPEDDPTAETKYENGKLTWQPRHADGKGYLDLHAVFGRDDVSGYALTYVHSPREQKATLRCGSAGPLRIWMNGRLVHEQLRERPARPDEDSVEVPLQAGWNTVLARVAGATGEHGLYLRFSGEGLRVAVRPDRK